MSASAPVPAPSETGWLLLHVLRCGGHAGLGRLAAASGLSESEAESELIDLAVEGLVTRDSGPGSWSLTGAGRAADAERTRRQLAGAGAQEAVRAAYDRFMVLNPELLDLCTAWQLRVVEGEVAVNRHDDPAYDARVLERFEDLHRRTLPVIGALEAALPRFGRYRWRLGGALERARAGESGQVTDTTSSYHTVWSELHEDLLATLGIER